MPWNKFFMSGGSAEVGLDWRDWAWTGLRLFNTWSLYQEPKEEFIIDIK